MDIESIPRNGLPSFEFEINMEKKGLSPVAGLDEVGRGALAGPVVVAAVILNPDIIPLGIDDSKKLTPKKREKIYEEIINSAIVSIASADHQYIDNNNIHKATLDMMYNAIKKLTISPKSVLIDGRSIPKNLSCQSFAIVKGDSVSLSIAAASIIAKVTRDRIMRNAHKQYPYYGFDSHVGYPTAKHLQAIKENGPSRIHRMTFRPLKDLSI
ncbi:MAG: ribonuclease HII [Candidatus Liberibacter europaeus]|uniref:Ribonuclease HII n=1 Tax=Candidatus Liberibacter europaeus TaxID=744859 RepID=A0A2T4VX50_9HYPH|nr:ribonuclease HII [Candidatus Liberibacter europaeus]PTL86350.1 MAG: ribonuclease HII [Candidatus Liberibacter europaeus]